MEPIEIGLWVTGGMLIMVVLGMRVAFAAALAGMLPNPPLTLDQLKLLKVDNICRKSAPGLADLGVAPTAIEGVVPGYLMPFRPGGRFHWFGVCFSGLAENNPWK